MGWENRLVHEGQKPSKKTMLACIACSNKDGGDDGARAATTKDAVKSLTSQIKDMVLKFSGTRGQSKPSGSSSTSYRSKSHGHHLSSYPYLDDDDDGGGRYTYIHAASSSSTSAWDFTKISHGPGGLSSEYRKWIPGIGSTEEEVVLEEDHGEPKEWMAQVEPGVHITFVSLPGCAGNDLKRIRFSREMFNKWQAQRWWGENYDRIIELYNVQRFSCQALPTPPRSDDGERESSCSRMGSTRDSPITLPCQGKERVHHRSTNRHPSFSHGGSYFSSVPDPTEHIFPHYLNHAAPAGMAGVSGAKGETACLDASRTTTSSRDEPSISISNASDLEVTEWVEQDEPGVFITIRELADGTRELRRVRFSRERFGEVPAKLWWEENRERIQAQYL